MNRNKYLLSAAAKHLVEAYKLAIADYLLITGLKVGIAEDSPQTFEELQAQAETGTITVNLLHSDKAIYGRDGNATFRVFHDLGHIIYNKKFVVDEEIELATIQWQDIESKIVPEMRAVCKTVYFADTVEQSKYCDAHGDFPVDQRAFVLNILNNQLVLGFDPK